MEWPRRPSPPKGSIVPRRSSRRAMPSMSVAQIRASDRWFISSPLSGSKLAPSTPTPLSFKPAKLGPKSKFIKEDEKAINAARRTGAEIETIRKGYCFIKGLYCSIYSSSKSVKGKEIYLE